VCKIKAAKAFGREFEPGLQEKLAKHIGDFYNREIPMQNAGLSVNLTEQAIDRQLQRIVGTYTDATEAGGEAVEMLARPKLMRQHTLMLKDDAAELRAVDYGISETPELGDAALKMEVLDELSKMVGIVDARVFFSEIEKLVTYIETGGNVKLLRTSLNMIITVSE
jgi:hypothetical protein